MLIKDEYKRLGSNSGASEVKQVKWFASVNWGLLRHMTPPDSSFQAKGNIRKKLILDRSSLPSQTGLMPSISARCGTPSQSISKERMISYTLKRVRHRYWLVARLQGCLHPKNSLPRLRRAKKFQLGMTPKSTLSASFPVLHEMLEIGDWKCIRCMNG